MIIKERNYESHLIKNKPKDLLDGEKLNSLGTIEVVLWGDHHVGLEFVCVETGLCRFDVCGKIDHGEFSDIKYIIGCDGERLDPDEFYNE